MQAQNSLILCCIAHLVVIAKLLIKTCRTLWAIILLREIYQSAAVLEFSTRTASDGARLRLSNGATKLRWSMCCVVVFLLALKIKVVLYNHAGILSSARVCTWWTRWQATRRASERRRRCDAREPVGDCVLTQCSLCRRRGCFCRWQSVQTHQAALLSWRR